MFSVWCLEQSVSFALVRHAKARNVRKTSMERARIHAFRVSRVRAFVNFPSPPVNFKRINDCDAVHSGRSF